MNRIEERFQRLKQEGQKGFVVYIGAGDPNLDAMHDLALAFDEVGVDVLELGVPFSDPLADGLVNQLAAQRGLAAGTTPGGVLETVARIRETSQIPIVLYVYFNILHKRGLAEFVSDAAAAGVDGLLVLDLPPEESENYESLMADAGICPILLVAPTTPPDRVAYLEKLLRQVMETSTVQARLAQLHVEPEFHVGDDLQAVIQERSQDLEGLQLEKPAALPPVHWLVLGLSLIHI